METPPEAPEGAEAPETQEQEKIELPAVLFGKEMFRHFLALRTHEARSTFTEAVLRYGFTKEEPSEDLAEAPRTYFEEARPFLDARRENYVNTVLKKREAGRAGKGVSRNIGNQHASKTYEERKLEFEEKKLAQKAKETELEILKRKTAYKSKRLETRQSIANNNRRIAEARAREAEFSAREQEARASREQEARTAPEAPEKTLAELDAEQDRKDREAKRKEQEQALRERQAEEAKREAQKKEQEAKGLQEALREFAPIIKEQFSSALKVSSEALNFSAKDLAEIYQRSPEFKQTLYKREALRRAKEGKFIGSELTLRKLRRASTARKFSLAPLVSQIMQELYAHRWKP